MITSEFDEIYSRFFIRVKDYDMAGYDENLAKEVLSGYVRSTLSKPIVRRLFSAIVVDDELGEIEYQLREPLDDISDKDFIEEVLSVGCVEAWAEPRYHSTLLTSQIFTSSEEKYYSQSAHLAEMKELYLKAQNDLRKLIRDRRYSLSVINGVLPT